jgi:Mg-chelatase subunit ChlI
MRLLNYYFKDFIVESLTGYSRTIFPFTAIVNQERLKTALILNAVNPRIGGVLIRGPKGTGKSTTVRALTGLLPSLEVMAGCAYGCNPKDPTNACEVCRERIRRGDLEIETRKMEVIDLPIGATEDRVVGSLNIERAIRDGIRALDPGVLAIANQNILYVDEINLLPDHITDVILDAAASGWNTIEREGISVQHPSRFILVGTMNPEEGELRPQLLDRMPLHVEISTIRDPSLRVEVMKRNIEFEREPDGFKERYVENQKDLMDRITKAKKILPDVVVPDDLFKAVAHLCISLNVDGHRPDIIIIKSASTLAAFYGRINVEPKDILESAYLTLSHRTRNLGMDPPATDQQIEEEYNRSLSLASE